MSEGSTLYERVGGDEFFEKLTAGFYSEVETEPLLRRLYPPDEEEFEAARIRLKWFLIQFWGGPTIYQEERGHPMLRRRHMPFVIGEAEARAWMSAMTAALSACEVGPLDRARLMGYFSDAASMMINQR